MLNGNPKTLASSISYLPYGWITGLTYGNTLSLSHGYDNQYRTSSIVVGSLMNRTYTYDANGNVASFVDTQPLVSDENAGLYTYQQATNKLTQVQGELNIVYGYDANGNITSANNRTFVYDLSNRLIRVEENSVTIAEYVYNGLNQRIKKILPAETRIFHYDLQGHLIAETTATGQTLVEYFYLGDQPLAMIRPTELLYYYHNDHLGTPQILTDDTGGVSWKAVYGPFGEAVISVETVENPLRFPGQYYDQETGLHYNWNRYYDPKTGRYLTPDPIGLKGGINLFVYVGNGPIRFVDPLGLLSYQDGVTPPNEDVVDKLKCMEKELGGANFSIGSGKRENDKGSAHGTGDAADISWNFSNFKGKSACDVVKAAKKCGFKRACQDKTDSHIHVDTDPNNKGGECGGVGWRKYKNPCACEDK